MRIRALFGILVACSLGCEQPSPPAAAALAETVTVTTVVVVTATPTPVPKRKPKPTQISTVAADAGPCGKLPSVEQLRTWKTKIQKYKCCTGSQGPASPPGGFPPCKVKHPGIVMDLGDGTHLVKEAGQCVRVRFRPECTKKCLPKGTRIATPAGELAVEALRVGDPVWTRNLNGQRVPATVLRVTRTATTPDHELVHARLDDGRSLRVSVGHPDVRGTGVEQWSIGDTYEGVQIVDVTTTKYDGGWTYDLLPSGETGLYWADGVPLASTIAD